MPEQTTEDLLAFDLEHAAQLLREKRPSTALLVLGNAVERIVNAYRLEPPVPPVAKWRDEPPPRAEA